MFYAKIDNDEDFTFRFYTKADRDEFVADHDGGRAITAKAAKFVPGAHSHVTYSGKTKAGAWARV